MESMNKTWHNNDTTMYTGEQVDRAAAYCDGTWSDFNGYIHGTVNSYAGNILHQVITYTLVFVETKVMVDSLNTHMDMKETTQEQLWDIT